MAIGAMRSHMLAGAADTSGFDVFNTSTYLLPGPAGENTTSADFRGLLLITKHPIITYS